MSTACSQCGGSGGLPITEADFAPLADERQLAMGGVLAVYGARSSRRFAVSLFQGLAFCPNCRRDRATGPTPFRLPKILAGTGFFLALTLLASPISFILYAVSFITLRRALRGLRRQPRCGEIFAALDAVGTLTMAVAGHVALLLVMGGVVAYMVYWKR